jgi:hypothetical protein
MPKKKKYKKSGRLKSNFQKDFKDIEIRVDKQIDKEFKEVEGWIIQRRKFLIKLAWVAGFITLLLAVSHFYLRIKGMG